MPSRCWLRSPSKYRSSRPMASTRGSVVGITGERFAILGDDEEVRPCCAGVAGDLPDPVDHPRSGVPLTLLFPELETIDDVEVGTIVAVGHDPVEGRLGRPQD